MRTRCPMPVNLWLFVGRACLLLVALLAAACATAPNAIPLHRGTRPIVHDLADLQIERGARCLVGLAGRETIRGAFQRMRDDWIEVGLDDKEGTPTRRVDRGHVVFIARLAGKSKATRGWLGPAIGALASVPLSISMPADMILPAALAGAAIGRATGDSRAEVIFERREVLPHDVKPR